MGYTFLFPGQGAQFPGMGSDLYDASDGVRTLFSKATEQVGFDVAELLFHGTEEELQATDRTQVAITAVNLAASRVLRERGLEPERCAGFSLGEYAALVAAGVLSDEDVFPIVRARGNIMEEVSRGLDTDQGPAGMSAILGLDYETVSTTLHDAAIDAVYPGIHNSPVQTVISGTAEALEAAETQLKEAGAKRVVRLKVSGPFHSPLMEDARTRFAAFLEDFAFSDPSLPVYSNVHGGRIQSGEDARELCTQQLVSPVMWVAEQQTLLSEEAGDFLEVGPGTVLGGLWKAYTKSRDGGGRSCLPAGTLEHIDSVAPV
jgi:[acyl-carrier-protein] S-malonyltransferase